MGRPLSRLADTLSHASSVEFNHQSLFGRVREMILLCLVHGLETGAYATCLTFLFYRCTSALGSAVESLSSSHYFPFLPSPGRSCSLNQVLC